MMRAALHATRTTLHLHAVLAPILRMIRQPRPVVVAACLLIPVLTEAHEIPQRVSVAAFVKPDSGRLRLLLRVPLESMRDYTWAQRDGYLVIDSASVLALQAARQWIAPFIHAWENGERLGDPTVVATRISLPTDGAFSSWQAALASTRGAPLDAGVRIPWNQAALDVLLEFAIADPAARFSIEPELARLGERTHTTLHYIDADGRDGVFHYTGDPGRVELQPTWFQAGRAFLALGVKHILGGIDHLLFVICLVLPVRKLRPLVLIVTAFTVAHSITLVAAALGVVPDALWFPPLVETLIAASIVYMALENIFGARVRRRWLLAFGFGLVHGFGFSFALAESLQFSGAHLALSLLTFNIGVEVGQLLVLAMAVPAVNWIFRRVPERMGMIVASAIVAHTAWHWMVDRGATLRGYSFTFPAMDIVFLAGMLRAALIVAIAAAAAWLLAEAGRRFVPEPRTTESLRT